MSLPSPIACPRCDGALERGFLIDRGDMNVPTEAIWASGEPRRGTWQVTAVARGERHMYVTVYRCTQCGRLESYATE